MKQLPLIGSAEMMLETIEAYGIIPFFAGKIPGYSIQERTRPGCWFDGDEDPLGPWDWKIECVHSGDIAYGKFLAGGKASFATVEWYKELLNIRQATLRPDAAGQRIMEHVGANGSISIKEVRSLLEVKKSAADAAISRLQYQCRLITGEITRVYRGQDLHYNGWQVSSFCRPEDFFRMDADFPDIPGFPFRDEDPLKTDHTPEESLEVLVDHILTVLPGRVSREEVLKLLR